MGPAFLVNSLDVCNSTIDYLIDVNKSKIYIAKTRTNCIFITIISLLISLLMKTTLLALWGLYAVAPAPCKAWLSTKSEKQILTITGHCQDLSNQPASYQYELVLQRHGPGGRSTNKQQGAFNLSPEQSITLSQVQLNADNRTSYSGQLRILNAAGEVVAQDSIRGIATRP